MASIQQARLIVSGKQAHYVAPNGLEYTQVGYSVECICQANSDDDLRQSIALLHEAVDNGADVSSPCWVTIMNSPFYAPLEYMCVVIHKVRVSGEWIHRAAKSMIEHGATLTISNTVAWISEMKSYAMQICDHALTPCVWA